MKPNQARTLTAMAMNCFYADEMDEGSDILNSALAIAPNDEVRSSNVRFARRFSLLRE
jgi:hypothetical protein